MIIGNTNTFAIESEIGRAYSRLSLRALGFFNIHISGMRYGLKAEDASLLACSFDAVGRRILHSGKHVATFSRASDPIEIANAFRTAFYGDKSEASYLGVPSDDFVNEFESGELVWAPDGDSAFDDGSYILQFDFDDQVRIIGFKSDLGVLCSPETLKDIWLPSQEYYEILQIWHEKFLEEWNRPVRYEI